MVLQCIDYFEDDKVILKASIDFNPGWDATTETAPTNGTQWIDIGTSTTKCFNGTFDGNGNTIRGIYMNVLKDYAGIFKYVGVKGFIQNLKLDNCFYKDGKADGNGWWLGSIVGSLYGSIDRVYASESVIVKSDTSRIGGLVGRYSGTNGLISNCWFAGKVTGGQGVAGILGHIKDSGVSVTLRNCYVTGDVICVYNSDNQNAAGFVGRVETDDCTLAIEKSLMIGTVTASNTSLVGSILGYSKSTVTIDDVYTTNDIKHVDGETTITEYTGKFGTEKPVSINKTKLQEDSKEEVPNLYVDTTSWNYEKGKLPKLAWTVSN